MKLDSHQSYKLRLLDDSPYELRCDGEACKFSAPASTQGVSKLYVVSIRTKILYVGISRQPVASRLRGGLNATGKNGYWGYKWKGERKELDFHIFTVAETGKKIDLNNMEAIEAEVVFLYRLNTGQWPASQNEIHFQKSKECHRRVAGEIYGKICN